MSERPRRLDSGWGRTRHSWKEEGELADQYESVRQWFLGLNSGSIKNYKIYMRKFNHYMGLNPDELLTLGRNDPLTAHAKLKEFWHVLGTREGLASKTKGSAYIAIRSFLRLNDVKLGKTPRMFIGKVQYEAYHVLETSEIAKMLDRCKTIRDQSLISFVYQSGQRTGIVSAMKYHHVQDDLETGRHPIVVNVNGELIGGEREGAKNMNKTGNSYRFAIGRESASFLRMNLNQRRSCGEKITSDSWLFPAFCRQVGVRETDNHPLLVWIKPGEAGPAITPSGIHRIVVANAKKAGIDRVRYNQRLVGRRTTSHKVHPHTLRRWWKFQMRRGGVIDSALLEHMLGQRNVKLLHGGEYDEFDPVYIRREYSKAEPYLTVTTDPAVFEETDVWKVGDPVVPLIDPRQSTRPSQEIVPVETSADRSGNCLHRVVQESELTAYFSRGWHYVATLPSGKVVIESTS